MPLYLGSNKVKIKSSGSRVLELYSTTPIVNDVVSETAANEQLIDENNSITTILEEDE